MAEIKNTHATKQLQVSTRPNAVSLVNPGETVGVPDDSVVTLALGNEVGNGPGLPGSGKVS